MIERVESRGDVGEVTYLPHRAVVRENKSTTKVRIVYDASAKNKGPSLNECLYKGPCLNALLYDIFFRFRVHNYGLIADIEKAYLQISVVHEHRNYLRFLWFVMFIRTILKLLSIDLHVLFSVRVLRSFY